MLGAQETKVIYSSVSFNRLLIHCAAAKPDYSELKIVLAMVSDWPSMNSVEDLAEDIFPFRLRIIGRTTSQREVVSEQQAYALSEGFAEMISLTGNCDLTCDFF